MWSIITTQTSCAPVSAEHWFREPANMAPNMAPLIAKTSPDQIQRAQFASQAAPGGQVNGRYTVSDVVSPSHVPLGSSTRACSLCSPAVANVLARLMN